jgi:hypothetical protein
MSGQRRIAASMQETDAVGGYMQLHDRGSKLFGDKGTRLAA